MGTLVGIALWALIPGFMAKKKGRNFWGYYFLSFLTSPLISMIIVACLTNLNISINNNIEDDKKDQVQDEFQHHLTRFCSCCGEKLIDGSRFCRKCGNKLQEDSSSCVKCGTQIFPNNKE